MVEKSLVAALHLALASAFWLLRPSLVVSSRGICPRCPADPEFLHKIRLQIMWLKRPTRDLYKSYRTRMDLQDDLRKFCEVPVAWLPGRNITKEPERLLLQELYAAVVRMMGALKALESQLADEENPSSRQLATVSLWLTGLLSNIQCALCQSGLRPVPVMPTEKSQDSSSFARKIEGCQVLWNLSRFIRGLAKAFQKKSVKGQRPERQKKKKGKKTHRSFLNESSVAML
ncbi:leukemia inhibitory factor-like [Ahaetulla prasina]|uniref:leukemia inhibitory factor-like n=1 Tax=Ahaetulla prasina TaxID=499056 RepID=UPI0026471FDA|nr:leukemia inhibitory factor-like [Ahaetulla prasina]